MYKSSYFGNKPDGSDWSHKTSKPAQPFKFMGVKDLISSPWLTIFWDNMFIFPFTTFEFQLIFIFDVQKSYNMDKQFLCLDSPTDFMVGKYISRDETQGVYKYSL